MAIPREQAFGCFEDLLKEGLRPCLTGFRAGDDSNPYWPKNSEGFFLSTRLETTERSEFTIEALTKMREIGQRHGLAVWFSGYEASGDTQDDSPVYGVRVVFEKESPE